MPIRHTIRGHVTPPGIMPRRLQAGSRALQRERDQLALFADEVLSDRETLEERIHRFDMELVEHDKGRRDLAAARWRWGRARLAGLQQQMRRQFLSQWNASSIPADAHYFADFVRRALWLWGIPIGEDA